MMISSICRLSTICLLFYFFCYFLFCNGLATDEDARVIWRKVDAYLTNQEQSLDAKLNMKQVIKLLRTQRDCCLPIFRRKNQFVELLQKFEQLKLAVEKRKCDLESKKLRQSLVSMSQNESCIRLSLVVWFYSNELAKVCQEEHMKAYLSRQRILTNSISNLQLFFMEFVSATLIGEKRPHRISPDSVEDARKYIKWAAASKATLYSIYYTFIVADPDVSSNRAFAARAYRILARISNESAQKMTKSVPEIRGGNLKRTCSSREALEIIEKQILEPCREFVDSFGPNLFDLAQLDVDFLEQRNIKELDGQDRAEFLFAWAQFKACKHLISNQSDRTRLLDYIGQEAELQNGSITATTSAK